MTDAEGAEATPLLTKIEGLLANVTGVQIIATFVRVRVWPLRARAHPMWAYEGPGDVTRMSLMVLFANELAAHVRLITCTKSSDPCVVKCAFKPYGPERRFEEVSRVCDCFCFFFLCFLIS